MKTLEQYRDEYHDQLHDTWIDSGNGKGFSSFCFEKYQEWINGEQ